METKHIAVGVLVGTDGRVLMMQRGAAARDEQGRWCFAGGMMEAGESATEAVVRELLEELGVTVDPYKQLATLRSETENHTCVTELFACRVLGNGEPQNLEPEKCEQIAWIEVSEVPAMDLASYAKRVVPYLSEL
jgi:mutator protein MutT